MIYLKLHDRLGNLMFMIAAALHVDKNVSVYCSNDRDRNYVARMVDYLQLPVAIGHPTEPVDSRWEYYTPTVYRPIPYDGTTMVLDGYFQSYRYFDRDDAVRLFRCPDHLNRAIEADWGHLLSSRETVSVHVRRGDYLALPERFPFVGKHYLLKAMSRFDGLDVAFIFTGDDIDWCKRHFAAPNVYFSEGHNEYYDLYLASKCRHNVLSNSTFSWWGGVFKQ